MHYNENSIRQQAVTAEGELQYTVSYPKAKKGQPTVRPIKEKATFSEYKMWFDMVQHAIVSCCVTESMVIFTIIIIGNG